MSYEPTIWKKGDKVTSTKLSKIEQGIQGNNSEITELKSGLSEIQTATSEDVGKALKAKTVTDGKVTEWEFGSTGLTDGIKQALLQIAQKVAYVDAQGQDYYDDLHEALYPSATLVSISAAYTQSGTVYVDTALDDLKSDIVVTGHYDDSSTAIISTNDYALSGTLTTGTSTLTVTYSGLTTTISVTVSQSSDMNQWVDGVAYRNLEVVESSYYNYGRPSSYAGWKRTGHVPCEGVSTIEFKANGDASDIDKKYCFFFDSEGSNLQQFDASLSHSADTSLTVPSGAYYFGISGTNSQIDAQLSAGIIPHA